VRTLAEPFGLSLPAVTKPLAVLQAAGLVRPSKTGRIRLCALATDALKAAAAWLSDYEEFWTDRLDALEAHLSETNREDHP
jgi:DNA-binding transcriptional ArsR family regulator